MEINRSPRTITEEIYQDIKQGILQNTFKPKEHLVERKLATLYGVSKTPVREALTRLEKEGLVKFISLKGAIVRQIDKHEIIQILEIREYLEALAGRKAAELIQPHQIQEMREIHSASSDHLNNIEEFQSYDQKFHKCIRKISDNRILLDMSEKLDNLFHIVLRTSMVLPTRGPTAAYLEHENIVRAILHRDPDEADKQSRKHIVSIREAVCKFYE